MFLCHFPSGCPAWELPSALPVWSSDLPLARGERSPGLLKPNKCNIRRTRGPRRGQIPYPAGGGDPTSRYGQTDGAGPTPRDRCLRRVQGRRIPVVRALRWAAGSARPPALSCAFPAMAAGAAGAGRAGRIVTKTRTVKMRGAGMSVARCEVQVRSVRYPLIAGVGVVTHHPLPHDSFDGNVRQLMV